jgi:hypothetical protein
VTHESEAAIAIVLYADERSVAADLVVVDDIDSLANPDLRGVTAQIEVPLLARPRLTHSIAFGNPRIEAERFGDSYDDICHSLISCIGGMHSRGFL